MKLRLLRQQLSEMIEVPRDHQNRILDDQWPVFVNRLGKGDAFDRALEILESGLAQNREGGYEATEFFLEAARNGHDLSPYVEGLVEAFRANSNVTIMQPIATALTLHFLKAGRIERLVELFERCWFRSYVVEGLDEAIRRGVPAEAARAFLMGHINVQLAITFGEIEARYSDGALKMLHEAQAKLFRPDWKKVFEPESVEAQLESILKPPG